MPPYLPIRALNRSQGLRIGTIKPDVNTTVYVDLGDGAQRRDLARHSSIGAIYAVGPLSNSNNSTGRVVTGGVVSEGADNSDLLLAVTAGEYRKEDGTYVSGGVSTTITISA